jgi:hypothetical protein
MLLREIISLAPRALLVHVSDLVPSDKMIASAPSVSRSTFSAQLCPMKQAPSGKQEIIAVTAVQDRSGIVHSWFVLALRG